MLCVNCKAEIPQDSTFCTQCGAKQPEQDATVYVGADVPVQEPVYAEPAAPQYEAYEQPVYQETYQQEEAPAAPKKKGKGLKFALIGVAVVVIGIVLALLLGGKGGKEASYGLYMKDEEMFFSNLKQGKELQVTSKLIDADFDYPGFELEVASGIGQYTTVTEDGSLIFFPDKIDGSSEGATIYYRPLNKPKADATKIDSDIVAYVVNDDASLVTYVKGESYNLYQYSMKSGDKEKVASDVEDFQVSDDGKKLAWLDNEGTLYFTKKIGDKEKVASDVTYMYSINDSFTTVYYEKEGTLYKQEFGKDKEKIASDVWSVLRVYDSGEIYYVQAEDSNATLGDFIDDDLAASDAAMVQPEWPEEPWYYDFETEEEYEEAYAEYETALEAYWEADDAYWQMQQREEFRAQMDTYEIDYQSYTLCYFDGKESVDLTEEFAYDWSRLDYAMDDAVLIYSTAGSASKIKMSELDYVWDAEWKVMESLEQGGAQFLAVGAEITELSLEDDAFNLTLDSEGKTLYYMANLPVDEDGYEEDPHCELYTMSISGKKVGKAEVYDEEVYGHWIRLTEDGHVLYFKDVSDNAGELFMDKESVDYDVEMMNVQYDKNSGRVFFYTDWDYEKELGTLKVSGSKKAEKINDDVNDYVILPNGDVLYLYDYDIDDYVGELHLYHGGKSEMLDEDVAALIPVYSGKYKGQY